MGSWYDQGNPGGAWYNQPAPSGQNIVIGGGPLTTNVHNLGNQHNQSVYGDHYVAPDVTALAPGYYDASDLRKLRNQSLHNAAVSQFQQQQAEERANLGALFNNVVSPGYAPLQQRPQVPQGTKSDFESWFNKKTNKKTKPKKDILSKVLQKNTPAKKELLPIEKEVIAINERKAKEKAEREAKENAERLRKIREESERKRNEELQKKRAKNQAKLDRERKPKLGDGLFSWIFNKDKKYNRGGNVMPNYKPWYAAPTQYARPDNSFIGGTQMASAGPLSKLRQAAIGKLLNYGLKAGATAAGLGPLASVAFNEGGPVYAQAGQQIDYTALANAANALIDQQNLADHNALRAQHATQPGLFGNVGNFAAPDRSDERASNRQGVLMPGVRQSTDINQHGSAGNYQQQARGNLNYLNEQAANNAALKEKASSYNFFNDGGHVKGHENHLTKGHIQSVKPDYKALGGMMENFSGKVGPLASVKYKKTGGEITHEHEQKFHNPLQAQNKPSGDK